MLGPYPGRRLRPVVVPPAGGVRRALELSGPEGTAGGLIWDAGVQGLTEFTLSGWVEVASGHPSNRTLFANVDGAVQIWAGSTNSGSMSARATGGSAAATSPAAYALDTWFHLHVQMTDGIDGTADDVRIYINGSLAAARDTGGLQAATLNGLWHFLQDDGEDGDFYGRAFDMAMFGRIVPVAERNQAGNLSWADFSNTANLITRLDGQTAGDATQDSSGNSNHWSQSVGGVSVVTSEVNLPTGANP